MDLYQEQKREIVSHFSEALTQGMVDFATDVALKWSRYIFTRRKGRLQFGYCTHCNSEFLTEGLKHGSEALCKRCSSLCKVKASGKGRKTMVDDAYFVYYEKSVIDPMIITARGIYVVRDYRFDYTQVKTIFETKALYVFEPGNSRMLQRPYVYYSESDKAMRVWDWSTCNSIISMSNNSMSNKPCYVCKESIAAAVEGSHFRYSPWVEFQKDGDMVKFFDLYSQYPVIEHITKWGFKELVEAKLFGKLTYGTVNWKASTPTKVLRIPTEAWTELRTSKMQIDSLTLRLFQIAKKEKSKLTLPEIKSIGDSYGHYYKDLQLILKRTTLAKAHAYITKQRRKKQHFSRDYQVLHTWRDYITDCVSLEMDLRQDSILFPPDLHRAHQNTIKQIKLKEDEALRAKFTARYHSLMKMSFQASGFLLRPARDQKELIDEGQALNHCVGTYAARYAKGETDLFVVRNVEEPDKPFYTMEIQNGNVVQCRGLRNCDMTPEVKAFVDRFKAEKLEKKKSRIKIQDQQEVAV